MEMSPERKRYHQIMSEFILLLSPKSTVYDIGKSTRFDYAPLFSGHSFKTIDRDPDKRPDIAMDIEMLTSSSFATADALLCNGVIEQCNDPMQMIRGCNSLLKSGGLILFGFCLLGYPPYDNDRFRFTSQGAIVAVKRNGFNIIKIDIVKRNDIESYIYVLAKKTI